MSTLMPVSEDKLQPESHVITRLWPRDCRFAEAEPAPLHRLDELEARLQRLESGQLTALDLVRQALDALKLGQTERNTAQSRAVAQLTWRLNKCEAALSRLSAVQQRDDETMRERLFEMGEALESVRATAAAAVRPAALHKLERKLERDFEERSQVLRNELDEHVLASIEAAEARGATALDKTEEYVWEDIIEIARRFDGLADSFLELRREVEAPDSAEKPSLLEATSSPLPANEDDSTIGQYADEEEYTASDEAEMTRLSGRLPASDVIPFPPQAQTSHPASTDASAGGARDVSALLSAAARRASEGKTDQISGAGTEKGRVSRTLIAPAKRLVTSAGSAVIAVCIMGGMSLLAGPALGPTFQGTPPAYAHDKSEWTAVRVAPQPITIAPYVKPVLRKTGKPRPLSWAWEKTRAQ